MKALIVLLLTALPAATQAQVPIRALETSARYSMTAANAPPGTCGCFFLQGAAMDFALPLSDRFSAVVDLGGSTVTRVPASPRGLSEITLLAGPRYKQPLGRMKLNIQSLFGAVRGFDSDFIVTPALRTDTSTNFAMALGGSLDVPVTQSLSLRLAQVDYLQTNLPNGVDNRQRNVRIGAGVVVRFRLPANSR